MPMGMYGVNPTVQYGVHASFNQQLDQGKGKGKQVDFEAAFAQIAESFGPAETQTSRIEEVDDSIANIEEALKNASLKAETEESGMDFQKSVNFCAFDCTL